ncbi:response regulator [Acidaminobacter sp. JC074]|uniref:phosphorylase family protein n=1 Tax=Acidaminobacter sp. JC074 TaxID=2530199 RepID=UPI001F0D6F0E|nr:response regulator [Acidaminobacter sp. JC074]MCH4891401.1 response regulator [Acidaminobacter sp. JC074]
MLKILIVDDESYKLKEVMKVIDKISEKEFIEVYHALDLKKAKEYLRKEQINLLITDLNMPEVLGQDLNPNGGFELIDEIIDNDFLNKPEDIIILTELESYDGKSLFQVLKYDANSTAWVDVIKSKIEYMLIRYQHLNHTIHRCDVAIITAVKVETEAVRKLDRNWEKIEYEFDPTLYYKTTFGDNIKIITAQQSEMGMSSSATLTTKMISHFNPEYIIMVGIAAGVGSGKEFGDIIIPSEVWNYSSGKYVSIESEERDTSPVLDFIPDPSSIKLDPKILGKSLQDFSHVLNSIKKSWAIPVENELKVVSGPMACGTAVVASNKIVDELVKKHSRKTSGLDMESYGMFYAAVNSLIKKPIPICMKSICDFADADKGDGYQNYAAYTSANFMKYFIESQLEL